MSCFDFLSGPTASGSAELSGKVKLTYWRFLGKNIAPALALELGGFDWEMAPGPGSKGTGNLWGEWLEMKPSTVWGFLPNVELPGGKKLGSEMAILQFLASKAPVLRGSNDDEYVISQELLHQSEELYQKIEAKVPTIAATNKSREEFKSFMQGRDKTTHSSQQGLQVYLAQFEEFHTKCRGVGGNYTSAGITVGEIKLYATLCLLVPLKADVFASYPNLTAFMNNFKANAKVKGVMDGRLGSCAQYFIKPP